MNVANLQTRLETNKFYFTMVKDDDKPLGRYVVPQTYDESLSYLEGERRLAIGDEVRALSMSVGMKSATPE